MGLFDREKFHWKMMLISSWYQNQRHNILFQLLFAMIWFCFQIQCLYLNSCKYQMLTLYNRLVASKKVRSTLRPKWPTEPKLILLLIACRIIARFPPHLLPPPDEMLATERLPQAFSSFVQPFANNRGKSVLPNNPHNNHGQSSTLNPSAHCATF